MSYTLSRLEREPIILASLSGQITDETLIGAFTEGRTLLRQVPDPCGFICDFQQVTALNMEGFEQLANALSERLTDIQAEMGIFVAFLADNDGVRQLGTLLINNGSSVPTFPDIEMAVSFLNLRIDAFNVKDSMNAPDTIDKLDETARVYVQGVMAGVLGNREDSGTSEFREGGIIRLEAVGMNKTTLIFPRDELIIGRRDSNNTKPDVDLSFWGGYRSGVSRRHARLYRDPKNHLYLTDLESSNGTFINNERLIANKLYLLHHGDEVKFGHLMTRITFEYRTLNEQ